MEKINFKYGKKIDSAKMKRYFDKTSACRLAKKFTESIQPGREIKVCPICLSKKTNYLQTIYRFIYRECDQCGVAFVSNPVREEQLSQAYRSKYYSETSQKLLANDRVINYRLKNIAIPKVNYVLAASTTRKKTWLDIGCGVGEIPAAAEKMGWDLVGIETNPVEREYARKKFHLNIFDEFISKSSLAKYRGKFGIISLFNVLEHLLDPRSILAAISPLQKKNDNLVIEVPHYPSFSCFSQITFPDKIDRHMHPPLHLFIFSFKSIKMLLEEHGYQITHAWFFGQDIYEILTTLPLVLPNFKDSILQHKFYEVLADFQEVIDGKKMSDQVLIIAKKGSG